MNDNLEHKPTWKFLLADLYSAKKDSELSGVARFCLTVKNHIAKAKAARQDKILREEKQKKTRELVRSYARGFQQLNFGLPEYKHERHKFQVKQRITIENLR